jgi:L,D-peptidoglycan transpeptidase YkuD (ErfK/YbiS/YcfS/YnhG family)
MNEENIIVQSDGILRFKGKEYRCALGKNGIAEEKVEGDGKTPKGRFPIREVWYRKDKLGPQAFPFPTHEMTRQDAWCDDPTSPDYNKHVLVDENATESLWREDNLYDVVVVLGYNDDPPIPGKGSAIFMHVARDGYTGTAGCIALSLEDLLKVLSRVTPQTLICVE